MTPCSAKGVVFVRQVQNGSNAALPGLAGCWDLAQGHHPGLARASDLLPLIKPEATLPEIPEGLPLTAAHSGHHLMQDEGYLAAAADKDIWPFAPLYVRDLAGRVLHTGLDPLPRCPAEPLTPATCAALSPQEVQDAGFEQRFLVHIRRLELAPVPGTPLDEAEGARALALYPSPHLYPYKLRIDSFYQDGFRLPQLERLHVLPAAPALAIAAGEEFLKKWDERPTNQPYEAFYEANQGAAWYEAMFQQGCTVIPTTEAYNGWYQVTEGFGMLDVMPGRAVEGLHQVAARQPSELPAGTILAVERPGFATREKIIPARVTVSDGAGWKNPFPNDPAPRLPDLSLPHPRVGGAWGDVWLPTHPGHFVQPALWDWLDSGHFVQVRGPLWDPLHYVYASTAKILKALRRQSQGAVAVPEEMRPQFHPVTALSVYDVPNARTRQERQRTLTESHPLYASALDQLPLAAPIAAVGYHPLPAALEYELDVAVMPELGPQRFPEVPAELRPRLLEVIRSQMDAALARAQTVALTEPETLALLNPALYPVPTHHPARDYPFLARNTSVPELAEVAAAYPCFLPARTQIDLFPNLQRLFQRVGYRQKLHDIHPELAARLQHFNEAALSWRRRRYRAWRRFLPGLLRAWWSYADLASALAFEGEAEHPDLKSVILAQQPAPKGSSSQAVGRLPAAANSAKLPANTASKGQVHPS